MNNNSLLTPVNNTSAVLCVIIRNVVPKGNLQRQKRINTEGWFIPIISGVPSKVPRQRQIKKSQQFILAVLKQGQITITILFINKRFL